MGFNEGAIRIASASVGQMKMDDDSSYGVRRLVAAFLLASGPQRRLVAALQIPRRQADA